MGDFPNFVIFTNAIAARNAIVLYMAATSGGILIGLMAMNRVAGDRAWLKHLIWTIGIGVYYASLVMVVIYWFSHPEIS